MILDAGTRPVGRLPRYEETGAAPTERTFRPDVQGLRAIAVALVVLFHAHVPGLGGGYVGVDVFFVISGFVITGVLLRERAATGSTSIRAFYGRRVRRILPAATLVIVAAVIASYAMLDVIAGNQTAGDARWASVFLINVHFESAGTNYLAALAPPSVLQNFWSLAVEEQFYLVYPTIFFIVASFSVRMSLRRRLGIVLGVVVLLSFWVSVVQTSRNPTAAYFSAVPRAWELALGAVISLATVRLRRLPPLLAGVISWLGLGGIMLSATAFSSTTSYPGWAVALPVVGTALVIAGGVAKPRHGAELLLHLRPFQWIGLVSYSLYLWHWPVLTIAAERSGTGSLSVWDSMFWVLVSSGLAVATYFLLENPIRHSRPLVSRRWASLALGGCLIVFSLTVSAVLLNRNQARTTLATPALAGAKTGSSCSAKEQKFARSLRGTGGRGSELGHPLITRIMLVGDSTACTMVPGLETVAAPAGVQIEDAAVNGCGVVSGRLAPDFVNGNDVNASTSTCQSRTDQAQAQALRSGRPSVVLWSSSWERASLLVDHKVLTQGSRQWYSVVQKRIEDKLRRFTSLGARVVMLTAPPNWDRGNPANPTSSDRDFERLNRLIDHVAARTPGVKVVDLSRYVCPSGPPCPLIVDNIWVRGDGEHYTSEGSLWAARWLMPRLGIPALAAANPLPSMRMLVPSSGAVLTGTRGLAAQGSFHLGVARVQFEVTGGRFQNAVVGTAAFAEYFWGLRWNTRTVPNGTYRLRSVAYNKSGDSSVSKAVTVEVVNTDKA